MIDLDLQYENRHGVVYQTYRETSTASEYRSPNYLDVEEPLEDVQRVEYYQNSPRRRERVVGYHIIRTSVCRELSNSHKNYLNDILMSDLKPLKIDCKQNNLGVFSVN